MKTIFSNGRLLDCAGDEPLENMSVIIEDGLIKDILPGNKVTESFDLQIDCSQKTIMPGLIDAHSHYAITTNDMGGVLHEFPLSDEESQAIISSQADTFQALASELNQWINNRLPAYIPGNVMLHRR